MTLAALLKANLHILINLTREPNYNKVNGKSFIPSNQLVGGASIGLEIALLLDQFI